MLFAALDETRRNAHTHRNVWLIQSYVIRMEWKMIYSENFDLTNLWPSDFGTQMFSSIFRTKISSIFCNYFYFNCLKKSTAPFTYAHSERDERRNAKIDLMSAAQVLLSFRVIWKINKIDGEKTENWIRNELFFFLLLVKCTKKIAKIGEKLFSSFTYCAHSHQKFSKQSINA